MNALRASGTLAVLSGLFLLVVPSAASSQQNLSFDSRVRVLEHWIDEQMSYYSFPGLSIGVVHGDTLVWSNSFGHADLSAAEPMTTDTRLRMGSVSKIFTSTAIVKLRDQGKLLLDDPVQKHLPWFRLELRDSAKNADVESAAAVDGTRYRAELMDGSRITLRHLLTHTGGLPREAAVPYWTDHVFPDTERLASAVRTQSALWPPGREYQYSNLGMGLLGEVIAVASGVSFGDYLEREIFVPLGMRRSTASPDASVLEDLAAGYMRRLPDGRRELFEYYDTVALSGAANVISTIEDMAKFASLHLRSVEAGRPSTDAEEGVLSAESLREMQSSQWMRDSLSSGRALGFSVTSRNGVRVVSHGGWIAGHRSHLIVAPESQVAVVAIVNADDVSPSFFAYEALDVLSPALAIAASDSGSGSASKYQQFEGTYSDPWHAYYEAMELDGTLYFYEHSYPPSDGALRSLTKLELAPEGGFVFGNAKDRVEFQTDSNDTDEVVRVLRRTDYLFPVDDQGHFTVSLPKPDGSR